MKYMYKPALIIISYQGHLKGHVIDFDRWIDLLKSELNMD